MPYPDEKLDRSMYALTINSLEKAGINQYEISNFSKPGFECRHNLGYWTRKEYLGFGLSAHSLYKETRHFNTDDMQEYVSLLNRFEKPVAGQNVLKTDEIISEYIILRMRLNKGVSIKDFNNTFELDFETQYAIKLDKLLNEGLIDKSSDSYFLTRLGMDLANKVFVEFV